MALKPAPFEYQTSVLGFGMSYRDRTKQELNQTHHCNLDLLAVLQYLLRLCELKSLVTMFADRHHMFQE
jgi:hypothetical protein